MPASQSQEPAPQKALHKLDSRCQIVGGMYAGKNHFSQAAVEVREVTVSVVVSGEQVPWPAGCSKSHRIDGAILLLQLLHACLAGLYFILAFTRSLPRVAGLEERWGATRVDSGSTALGSAVRLQAESVGNAASDRALAAGLSRSAELSSWSSVARDELLRGMMIWRWGDSSTVNSKDDAAPGVTRPLELQPALR